MGSSLMNRLPQLKGSKQAHHGRFDLNQLQANEFLSLFLLQKQFDFMFFIDVYALWWSSTVGVRYNNSPTSHENFVLNNFSSFILFRPLIVSRLQDAVISWLPNSFHSISIVSYHDTRGGNRAPTIVTKIVFANSLSLYAAAKVHELQWFGLDALATSGSRLACSSHLTFRSFRCFSFRLVYREHILKIGLCSVRRAQSIQCLVNIVYNEHCGCSLLDTIYWELCESRDALAESVYLKALWIPQCELYIWK